MVVSCWEVAVRVVGGPERIVKTELQLSSIYIAMNH